MGNGELVDYLQKNGWAKSEDVRKAFLKVDRANFVPKDYSQFSYYDDALPVGHGQTISAPSVVAFMLERLFLEKGQKVLEIGTGSGYNTALLAEIIGPKGKVVTVERVPELTGLARRNIDSTGRKYKNIQFINGDGTGGCPEYAPYDRITATAALPSLPLDHPLLRQLKPDGIFVGPVGERFWQDIVVYFNKDKRPEKVLPVMFVPMIGEHGFKE